MYANRLGRTQRIFVGVLLFPFTVASAALFFGVMDPATWVDLMRWLATSVAVPFFGFGATHKVMMARSGQDTDSPTPTMQPPAQVQP